MTLGARWRLGLQRAALALVYRRSRALLRADRGVPPPEGEEYLTTVVRLPREVVARLEAEAAAVCEYAPQHHRYPPETVHLTVLNLDGRLDVHAAEGAGAAALARVIARHAPFAVELRGLNVSPTTVFAQVLVPGGELARLRRALRRALPRHEPGPGRLRESITVLFGHANVLRFVGPVDEALLEGVARRRSLPLGEFRVEEVEFVLCDRLLSAEGTRVLQRFRLGASAPTPVSAAG